VKIKSISHKYVDTPIAIKVWVESSYCPTIVEFREILFACTIVKKLLKTKVEVVI